MRNSELGTPSSTPHSAFHTPHFFREARGGVTTFLTMAYILVANPAILASAGVPFEAAVAATAASAGVCSILMGIGANFPLALAPGMGLNAVVAFQLAPATGSWQVAMGLVVLDGLVVLALVLLGLRQAIMDAIPLDLRRAIGVGIGLFIALIGAVNARLVVVPAGTVDVLSKDRSAILPPVTHGSLLAPETAVAVVGLVLIALLVARRVSGAILIGIAFSTLVALGLGITRLPQGAWVRVPGFETFLQADVAGAATLSFVPLLLAIVLVDFFDTIGTVTAIADAGELRDRDERVPRIRRILAIDAVSASIGGLFGASSVTSYVESAAGVAEGARSGFHSIVVGVLFLLAAFAAPIAAIVPAAATAPALMVVGFLMCQPIARIDFARLQTAIPAFLIFVLVPFTYSISHGIGYGFISYVLLTALTGRAREAHPLMYATAAAFGVYFLFD